MLSLSCRYKISALERRKTSSTPLATSAWLRQSTLEGTLEFLSNGTDPVAGCFTYFFNLCVNPYLSALCVGNLEM